MLATYWMPNPDPIGAASLWPLGIVVALAAILHFTRWRWLAPSAAVLMAIFAVLSAGFPFASYRRFPNADDFVGYYIWNLAACCFAWESARSSSARALIFGGGVIFSMGWLLVLETTAHCFQLANGMRGLSMRQSVLVSLAIWCPLFLLLMHRAAQPYMRSSRIARGLCGRCGYNVQESPDRCPECGEAGSASPVN